MAVQAFTNANVKVNGVDLSTWVSEVQLDITRNPVEVTAMGAGGKQFVGGLEETKVDVIFWQDFAASGPAQTLQAIHSAGTAIALSFIPSGTVPGATNPHYTMTALLTDYPPLQAKVGDAIPVKASFVVSGTITQGTV